MSNEPDVAQDSSGPQAEVTSAAAASVTPEDRVISSARRWRRFALVAWHLCMAAYVLSYFAMRSAEDLEGAVLVISYRGGTATVFYGPPRFNRWTETADQQGGYTSLIYQPLATAEAWLRGYSPTQDEAGLAQISQDQGMAMFTEAQGLPEGDRREALYVQAQAHFDRAMRIYSRLNMVPDMVKMNQFRYACIKYRRVW